MRRTLMRLFSLLFATTLACGGTKSSTPSSPPPASPATANLPIAQYLGADDATGQRVFDLLRTAGIESSAGGSVGYSVWVSSLDRAKARRVLHDAVTRECLAVSIFDDSGQQITTTRPARCTETVPAVVDSSK